MLVQDEELMLGQELVLSLEMEQALMCVETVASCLEQTMVAK